MTGVIYARYSSDNQREESIEGQIRENTAFAEKNGITIVGHYIDRAYSAKTDNRPEFQRMIHFKNEPVTVPTSEEFDAIEKRSDIEAFASPAQEARRSVLLFFAPVTRTRNLTRRRSRWVRIRHAERVELARKAEQIPV